MLKFAISLMRKIGHTVEANVPLAGIMAKLQFGNNVLRNDSCKLEKHLEVRMKILEAINDRRVQDKTYITSVQHAKLVDRLRMADKLTDKGKGLLNNEGKPKTKLEAKMRKEDESKLLKVPLWHRKHHCHPQGFVQMCKKWHPSILRQKRPSCREG
ncbi:hypothetical protein EV2_024216 [Malus domestica]